MKNQLVWNNISKNPATVVLGIENKKVPSIEFIGDRVSRAIFLKVWSNVLNNHYSRFYSDSTIQN